MRISNVIPSVALKLDTVINKTSDKNAGKDSSNGGISISNSAKNTFGVQFKNDSILNALFEQKQNIIDSKSNLIERATENGGSLDSIREQLKNFDEQIESIDKQIEEHMFKEQQKALDTYKKKYKVYDNNKPETDEEVQNRHLNNIISTNTDISKIRAVLSLKSNMKGQINILTEEIKFDEARSITGQKASLKREQLSKINEKISEIDEKIGKSLKDIQRKIKDNNDREESEKKSDKIASYEEIEKSLTEPSKKSRLETMA
ncbi:hypothetical protein ACSVC9_10005 [Clostridium sp. LBM24168]